MKNPEFRNPKRTICEVHREMWRMIKSGKFEEKAFLRLIDEAYSMGKKMNKRLKEYKYGGGDNN